MNYLFPYSNYARPIKRAWAVALLLTILSCRPSASEYRRWVRDLDNGLHKQLVEGEVTIDVQYQPAEYLALQRTRGNTDDVQFNQLVENAKGTEHFILTLGKKDGNEDFIKDPGATQEDTQQKLYYYSYSFQQDITLRDETGKEWPCVLYHFEKTSDLQNSRKFVLGFETPPNGTIKPTFIIHSSRLPGGAIEIQIDKSNIPSLNL